MQNEIYEKQNRKLYETVCVSYHFFKPSSLIYYYEQYQHIIFFFESFIRSDYGEHTYIHTTL